MPVQEKSGVHLIYPKVRVWVAVKNKKISSHEKTSIKTLKPKLYSGMYNNGDTNQLQYIFEWESTKKKKILPCCRSLRAENICGAISAAIFFVSWYRHIFCGYKIKYLSRWCLDIWSLTDEGLGIYPIWKIQIFFLPTLDGSASILRPKYSMDFLH